MKHLFTLLFLGLSFAVFSQKQAETDSLIQVIEQLKEDDRKENLAFRIILLTVLPATAAILFFGSGYRNRKKAEAAQIAASKDREFAMQREQLYVNVTHELRTPLTLIISPLEKLAREAPHPLVYTALRSARELEIRFNDILKWNKLEANAMSVVTTVGCFEMEIQKIVSRFRPMAEGKGITIHFQTGGSEHWMELDFEKLQTILSNLLVNALKFTKQGEEIWVETAFFEKDSKPCFQLTVRDNGEDIPSELLPAIFDRFTQAEQSKPGVVGSGIGLALARELVRLMGGEISASSEPGTGAEFSVSLPYQSFEKEEIATLNEPAVDGSKQAVAQVLLVEDNQELRDFIIYSFSGIFEILEANNAAAGLRLAVENLPDVIISDIMLEGEKDGIQLCRELKENPLTCHIPVLMLTAKTNFETRKASLEAGSEVYLTKPFSVKELELMLRNLMENRRRLQEQFQRSMFQQHLNSPVPADPVTDPFLEEALRQINLNLDNSQFGVEQMAQNMRISRVQLFKKIKTLTGIPPADLLRNIRLEKARQMLENRLGNVSQVAYSTGFDNPNYFSKAFKKHFGVSPSTYTS